MNLFLWFVQILLALHTLLGAVWKLSNSEQTVPSLSAIPHGVWLALSAFEVLCAVGLILPIFKKSLAIVGSLAALGIAAEMLFFSGMHIHSGATNSGELIYWLVVAAIAAFVAFGRFMRKG